MDIIIIIAGTILIIAGIAGCILPVLPGPHLAWLALLLLQFSNTIPHNWNTVWITFLVATAVQVMDYIVPAWGTKKFGGSKYGMWGAMIGLLFGLLSSNPFGFILGPFIGAFAGEIIKNNDARRALKAAFGSFAGFLLSTGLKLAVTLYFGYIFFEQVINNWPS
jgi:uncharacterized protein YqgC (DUF456 family)